MMCLCYTVCERQLLMQLTPIHCDAVPLIFAVRSRVSVGCADLKNGAEASTLEWLSNASARWLCIKSAMNAARTCIHQNDLGMTPY